MRDALFIYLISYTKLLSILHVYLYLLMGLIKSKTFLKKGTEMRSDEGEERSEVRAEEGGEGCEGPLRLLAAFDSALRSHQVKLIFNNADCTD